MTGCDCNVFQFNIWYVSDGKSGELIYVSEHIISCTQQSYSRNTYLLSHNHRVVRAGDKVEMQHLHLDVLVLFLAAASFTLARNVRVIKLRAPQKWTKELAGLVT